MSPDPTSPSGTSGQDPSPEFGTSRFREAYERQLPAMMALDPHELANLNIDVPSVVTLILGVLPKIQPLRAAAKAKLPDFDLSHFDTLEGRTLALAHAHALATSAAAPSQELVALNDEGVQLRASLAKDADALASHGLLEAHRLAELKGPVGYRNVAMDLIALANLVRESWPKIAGKTAITPATVDRADQLADRLLNAVGAHEQAPTVTAEASVIRQRAFTLFVRDYDQVRRAVTYLRWDDGDADAIAPSPYVARGSTHKKAELTPTPQPTPSPAPQPAPSAAPVPVGMPGGSPYVT